MKSSKIPFPIVCGGHDMLRELQDCHPGSSFFVLTIEQMFV